MPDRTENRYMLRREDDASWTVYDIFTGLPVVYKDRVMIKMTLDDADDMTDLLNALYIRTRKDTS